MSAKQLRALERAKIALGWGWINKPCYLCGSEVSRKSKSGVRCFWHWSEPVQLGLLP